MQCACGKQSWTNFACLAACQTTAEHPCRTFTGDPGPRPEHLVKQLDFQSCPMIVLWGEQV